MKKILAIGLGFTLCLAFIFVLAGTKRRIYNFSLEEVEKWPSVKDEEIIQEINERNAKIKNIQSNDVTITIKKRFSIRLKGSLAYEKDLKFRMIIKSFLGRRDECDVGSNDSHFWYWSRRLNPPSLYYAEHKNLMVTGLRLPFHPLWMMEAVSIGKIDTKNAVVKREGDRLVVLQPRTSTLGASIIKATLIDTKTKRIIGHYIYDNKGNIKVSTEVRYSNGVLSQIQTIWYEENVLISFDLLNVSLNKEIDASRWEMPNGDQINIGTTAGPRPTSLFSKKKITSLKSSSQ